MSKKHKKQQSELSTSSSGGATSEHYVEYRVIKHDLWKVVYLNAIYLAAILILYFTDQKTQYLEHWLGKALHF